MTNRYFASIKTGHIYKLLYEGKECTNGREDKAYFIYVEADDEDHLSVFIREKQEFLVKFKEV